MIDAAYIIEPLDKKKHNRAAFSCGVELLDRYLKEQANQDARKNVAKTYIATEVGSSDIIGYYTLSAADVKPTDLPDNIVRRLPHYDAFSAMLIGRLAVDQHYRGHKLGRYLLLNALERCLELSESVGVMAVLVDAKDREVAQFYERYGFLHLADGSLRLYIPVEEIKLLMGR